MSLAISHENEDHHYELFVDGKLAGGFRLNLDLWDKKKLCIWNVFILEEFQGKGLGQRMMEYLVLIVKELAPRNNLKSLWLNVWANNHRARHVYEKSGFNYINETSTEQILEMEILL